MVTDTRPPAVPRLNTGIRKVRPQVSKYRAFSERRVFWYTTQFGKADGSELAGCTSPSSVRPRKLLNVYNSGGGAAGRIRGNDGD